MRACRSRRRCWCSRASTPTSRADSARRAASRRVGSKRWCTASSMATAARTTSTPSSTSPSVAAAPRSARSTTAPSAPTSPTSRNSAGNSRPYAGHEPDRRGIAARAPALPGPAGSGGGPEGAVEAPFDARAGALPAPSMFWGGAAPSAGREGRRKGGEAPLRVGPMPKLTIDGKDIEVEAGTNLIEAARRLGIEVPHYCYHPGLSIAGQCRLCMVDIEKTPRPSIACNTPAAEGMVVHTQTERVKDMRRSMMEFHLINHPLDCPVCDQAGECWLQIYYMQHGLYDPRVMDEKVHKPKAVPLGRHVMLDAERCILCSRCVRFCDEITKTGELGIFNRGDHSEIGLFPGQDLENNYSGNVVDICPVGALTDRDFRFRVRVWYLDTTKSICPGCARGCNVEVHVNRKRPHHAEGRRVARLKPRFNDAVNAWWICDVGRYGFDAVDDPSRIRFARRGDAEVELDEALNALLDALRRHTPAEIAILASPDLANEDLFALRRLIETLGIRQVAFGVPPAAPTPAPDDFLLHADRHPNTRGAETILPAGDASAILAAARAGRVKVLWVFQHDLLAAGWSAAETRP